MIRHEPIKYTSEFIEYILGLPLAYGDLIYRGQAICRNLTPSVARAQQKTTRVIDEEAILRKLSLLGTQYIPAAILESYRNDDKLDLLVLAQHFGLKTRLLDWTSNPLIALWFACQDRNTESDVYIYCLGSPGLIAKDIYKDNPFNIKEIRVFEPRLNNQRILAQQGLFTIHPRIGNGFKALENEESLNMSLHEILIPKDNRWSILSDLSQLGVNERTLMPDLEGLCRHLNWEHQ